MDKFIGLGRELLSGFIISVPISIIIIFVAYGKGLISKYVSGDFGSIGVRQIEYVAFSYIDKTIVDTVFTMIFWTVIAVIGLAMMWILVSTYTSISNVLTIDTAFKNKPKHFLLIAVEHILQRVLVSVLSIFGLIVIIKLVIPSLVEKTGSLLLSSNPSFIDYLYTVLIVIVLASVLNATIVIVKEAAGYIKSPL